MKHLWKILFLIPIVALFQVTYSGPLGVDKIDVVDQNTIKVTLSENPNLKQGNNEGEITILNDIRITTALAKVGSSNEVEVILEKPLLPETSYSLLTVAGAVGSIDFTTPGEIEGYSQINVASLEAQDIESLEIIDSTTVNITYKQAVTAGKYDYKFLAESTVKSIEKPSFEKGELLIRVEPPLVSDQDYILMVIDLKDVDGNQLEFDTGIYDFKTPVFSESVRADQLSESAEQVPDLNAAQDNMSLEKETLIEEPIVIGESSTTLESESNLAAVAAEVQQTPATGTATWLLILATLSINAFYFYSRRKKA